MQVAFPLAIGTSLVLGTVLIYLADPGQPPASPARLFLGVACGFVAVVAIAVADRLRTTTAGSGSGGGAQQQQPPEGLKQTLHLPINSTAGSAVESMKPNSAPRATSPTASAIICLISGLLMSCWGPLSR